MDSYSCGDPKVWPKGICQVCNHPAGVIGKMTKPYAWTTWQLPAFEKKFDYSILDVWSQIPRSQLDLRHYLVAKFVLNQQWLHLKRTTRAPWSRSPLLAGLYKHQHYNLLISISSLKWKHSKYMNYTLNKSVLVSCISHLWSLISKLDNDMFSCLVAKTSLRQIIG